MEENRDRKRHLMDWTLPDRRVMPWFSTTPRKPVI